MGDLRADDDQTSKSKFEKGGKKKGTMKRKWLASPYSQATLLGRE